MFYRKEIQQMSYETPDHKFPEGSLRVVVTEAPGLTTEEQATTSLELQQFLEEKIDVLLSAVLLDQGCPPKEYASGYHVLENGLRYMFVWTTTRKLKGPNGGKVLDMIANDAEDVVGAPRPFYEGSTTFTHVVH